MTKQQIMARAHEIARQCEGNYGVRLAIGLRQAWVEARLIAAGGSRWQKNGMNRIYFNDLATWYGLKLDHYNSGNICYAELNGERISNTQAGKLCGRIGGGKAWFDCNSGVFCSKDLAPEYADAILSNIQNAAHAA